jgi:glyoxylase-like metal-dependent hydrolase (beta-lactamase superfamily II)
MMAPADGISPTACRTPPAMLKAVIIPVTPFQQNCSLVWDEARKVGAVVDPGGDLDRILAVIDKNTLSIEKILITHGHLDHAGGTAELAARLKVPVEGPHEADRFWIDGMAEQCRAFGMAGGRPFTPDRWLQHGDEVHVGGLVFSVHHCPGHTPGHVVFFNAAARLAIVGDVLFAGSIGRTDFPQGDYDTLIRSITEVLLPLGDDVRFIPGHGPMSSFGVERQSNPFLAG